MSLPKLKRRPRESKPTRTFKKRSAGIVAGLIAAAFAAAPLAGVQAETSADPDTPGYSAVDRPMFQLPFECGETWNGNTQESNDPPEAIDFNGTGIAGTPVTVSALGEVVHVQTEDSADVDGHGNAVFVEHDDGWFTTYAHLDEIADGLQPGDFLGRGAVIGTVGSSGDAAEPQLRYEQRTGDYAGEAEEVHLNGEPVHYYGDQDYLSGNACDSNPHTPEELCGEEFVSEVDSAELLMDDYLHGVVHLLADYSDDVHRFCAVTLKHYDAGVRGPIEVSLSAFGDEETDSGDYDYYAGPVFMELEPGSDCMTYRGEVDGVWHESDEVGNGCA